MYLLSADFRLDRLIEITKERSIVLNILCPDDYEGMTELRIGWNGIVFAEARRTADICTDTFYSHFENGWKTIKEMIYIENMEVKREWDTSMFPDGIYVKSEETFLKILDYIIKCTINDNPKAIMECIMKW